MPPLLRLGTAETAAILNRFTRNNLKHPTYLAFAELAKAIKTIFLRRYLHSEALRREIQEGLNVIETWNGASSFILYGKGGEIGTNDPLAACASGGELRSYAGRNPAKCAHYFLNGGRSYHIG